MKRKIRKKMLGIRRKFDNAFVAIQSYRVYKKIIPFLENLSSIHIYYSMNNEIETKQIIRLAWARGIKVVLPRTDFEKHSLTNYVINDWNDLEPTKFNMLEPKIDCEIFQKILFL